MPRLFLSWLLLLASVGAYAANVRTAGPFSGSQRGGSVTVLDDGRIMALGGDTAAIWDPEQRKWNLPRVPELQGHRYLHTATLVANDHIVFAGGLDASGNSRMQQTALSSVTLWRAKEDIWESAPSLLGPRFGHAAVALSGGDVLVIGGAAAADHGEPFGPFLASVERLEDKTTISVAPMKFARVGHTATVLPDGRVMVIGGLGDDRAVLASVEIYDAANNTWQSGPPLATARQGHSATMLPDGRVLVAGGMDAGGTPLTRAEVWSKELGVWQDAGELLMPRSRHAATLLKDGSVLLSGGIAYGLTAARTLERWNSSTNQWTVAGESPLELRDHHAALQPDGSVLLFGSDLYEREGVVLVWLPDEEESQQISGVVGASLTPLEDGRVLLAGGHRRQSPTASVSIYDFKTDRWVAAAPMHLARTGHRAVRLPDGRVLVAGGQVAERIHSRPGAESLAEPAAPLAEIWDPKTDRWTVTEDIAAAAEMLRTEPSRDESGLELYPLADGSVLRWKFPIVSLRKAGEEQWMPIRPDTRWNGLIGIVDGPDGKTYAFRNADWLDGSFSRLGVVVLNNQAERWEPNTHDYIERESPAMLALSDKQIMVAGGSSAVVQILNTATDEWRYTGWLPAPVRAPTILSLRDGGIMLAGRLLDDEATVVCALWDPDNSVWSECGRFTDDAGGQRRAPVLRDFGAGQTLLVYGNEHALVRGRDGSWVATKLEFPKESSIPYLRDAGVAYTSNLGSVWNPAEKTWVDATDVLFVQRHNMQATRTPDRRWILASRDLMLQWQSNERMLSRLSPGGVWEQNLDRIVPVDDGCAVLWNNSRELAFRMNQGAYAPVMYVRNFVADTWSSAIDAPAAPLRASGLVTKDHQLIIAGASRDALGGSGAWGQYQVSCDKVPAIVPVGPNPTPALFLPTRPPSTPKTEPVKAVAVAPPPSSLTYIETWKATASSLVDSVTRHIRATIVFGGLGLALLLRFTTQFSVYVVDDDGRVPGRVIDLAILAGAASVLVAAFGAPWPGPRGLVLLSSASLIVFAANRLWTNIGTLRGKVLYGVPLGASVVICALAIGGITSGFLAAMIDYLRDY